MRQCKFFSIAAMSLACGLAVAADTVTLSSKGMSVAEVLQEISKQTGIEIECSASIKGIPLFIEVKDMPTKTFFDRLLKIVDADWDRRGDVLILSRGNIRSRRALEAEINDRAPRLADAIKKYLDANKAREDWSDEAMKERVTKDLEARRTLEAQIGAGGRIVTTSNASASPGTLVLHEALRRIPAAAFAAVLPGDRLVFSSSANSKQRPLPYNPAGTIEQFIKVHNRVVDSMEAANAKPGDRRVTTDLASQGRIERIVELIVAVERFSAGDGFSVVAYLVDPQGDIVAQPRAWLTPSPMGSGTPPVGVDQSVTLPAESVSLLQVLRDGQPAGSVVSNGSRVMMMMATEPGGAITFGGPDQSRIPVPAELRARMLEPTKHEPLGWVVGDLLSGLGAKTGRQIMATVPDDLLGKLAQSVSGNSVNLKALWTQAGLGLQITSDENGWLIHPRLFAEADRQRVDRVALEKLLKSSGRLADTAKYATVMSAAWNVSALDARWIKPLDFNSYRQLDDRGKRPFLKIYGHLPDNARRPARGRNAQFAVSQLAPAPRAIAESLLMQAGGPMMIGEGMITMAMEGRPPQNQVPQIMTVEPTEAFPNGIDGRARLEITVQTEEGLYAMDAKGQGEYLNPRDVGFRLGLPAAMLGAAVTAPNYVEYQIADVERIQMALVVPILSRRSATLDDWGLRKPATKYTLATLPANIKEQIERGRQMAANIRTGATGAPPTRPPSP